MVRGSLLACLKICLHDVPGLYNAFLAPGSPCELNIDHALRNSLAGRMTRAVGDEESMLKSLHEVVELFEHAQVSVFKLMSSVSIICNLARRAQLTLSYRTLCRNLSAIRNTQTCYVNMRRSSAWLAEPSHQLLLDRKDR